MERVRTGVTKVVPGDHVVLTFASCGQCRNCLQGRPTACINFLARNFASVRPDGSPTLTRNGAPLSGAYFAQSSFATYALANESKVVRVPNDVPLELLGPLGCGIQTGAGAVLNSLGAEAGSSLAIFGAGSVGMAALLGAVVAGCTTIVAVDPNQERLNLAVELGATHTVDPNRDNPVEAVGEATAGFGADDSLECTGIPAVLRQAVDCLAVPGTCGVVGVAPMGAEVSLDIFSLLSGRTVRGIIEGDSVPHVFIPALVNLCARGGSPSTG